MSPSMTIVLVPDMAAMRPRQNVMLVLPSLGSEETTATVFAALSMSANMIDARR